MHLRAIPIALLLGLAACAGPSPSPTDSPGATPTSTSSLTPQVTASASPTSTQPASSATPSMTPTEPASPTPSLAPPPEAVGLETWASGFDPLVLLANPNDGSGLLFAVEQPGRVLQLGPDGASAPQPYLDITDRVGFGGERGLLGLAFHPEYASNGRLFVNYTDRDGTTTISELTREPGCDCADPGSERVLLTIAQPFANHNGGMLAFGADGYLYISTGDGGGGGDPLDAGQDLGTLLGKILRIDVDQPGADAPYSIPTDNPFVGDANAMPEIWAYGLRNPWRMSFDSQTGDLFIGDVGQGSWEEIDAEPAGQGGRNYGWNTMEGPRCFEPRSGCDRAGITLPAAAYQTGRQGTCAVTGGYVYRGSAVPGLAGTYLFSDYCSGTVWGIDAAVAVAGERQDPRVLAQSGVNVTGFGQDAAGEVYLVTAGGEILRVVASTPL